MTERTPAGGDRSEITFLDNEGRPTDGPERAVEAEIREYAGDVMIRRTYMARGDAEELPMWTPPGEVRAEPDVSDPTKNTWNVWDSDEGIYRLATTVESLLSALGKDRATEAEQRAFLTNLTTLPSFRAAPPELKQDVAQWLARR